MECIIRSVRDILVEVWEESDSASWFELHPLFTLLWPVSTTVLDTRAGPSPYVCPNIQ